MNRSNFWAAGLMGVAALLSVLAAAAIAASTYAVTENVCARAGASRGPVSPPATVKTDPVRARPRAVPIPRDMFEHARGHPRLLLGGGTHDGGVVG